MYVHFKISKGFPISNLFIVIPISPLYIIQHQTVVQSGSQNPYIPCGIENKPEYC